MYLYYLQFTCNHVPHIRLSSILTLHSLLILGNDKCEWKKEGARENMTILLASRCKMTSVGFFRKCDDTEADN
jgi:hypothetical protein